MDWNKNIMYKIYVYIGRFSERKFNKLFVARVRIKQKINFI